MWITITWEQHFVWILYIFISRMICLNTFSGVLFRFDSELLVYKIIIYLLNTDNWVLLL